MAQSIVSWVLIILAITLLACSSSTPTPEVTPTPVGTPTPIPPPTPTYTSIPPPTPVEFDFQGRGDSVVGTFNLVEGIALVLPSHSGSGNFIISIVGEGGDEVLTVNEIGRYTGVRGHAVRPANIIGLTAGSHRMEVSADGSWTISVVQKFPSGAQSLPLSVSGNGNDVVTWLKLDEGQPVMSANHTGSGNFIVELIEASGDAAVLMVNEIGGYQGEHLIKVDPNSFGFDPVPGIYAIIIQADGDWELRLAE